MLTSNYLPRRFTGRRLYPIGHRPRHERLRQVWAAVSANPQATYREIAAACGYRSQCQIQGLLEELASYGYIRIDTGEGARQVLVPFVVVGKG